MYFSWRPQKAIALSHSDDGINWTDPAIVLEYDSTSGWEDNLNRSCTLFYIGYTDITTARIGVAISPDGITGWKRLKSNPLVEPDPDAWDGDACYKPSVVLDREHKRWLLWYNGRKDTNEYIGLVIHKGVTLE